MSSIFPSNGDGNSGLGVVPAQTYERSTPPAGWQVFASVANYRRRRFLFLIGETK
ncbi:MAG: hypothetical protein OEY84_01495 [Rhodospirillaceae bacterium]|nr:hypothetical protein [Rhodospirillaceae bacterium]